MEYPLPEKEIFCCSSNFVRECINFTLVSEVTRGKKTSKVSFFEDDKRGKLLEMCKRDLDFVSSD